MLAVQTADLFPGHTLGYTSKFRNRTGYQIVIGIAYLSTDKSWLYLTAITDASTCETVGPSVADRLETGRA
jgi:hypothetical protein